MKKTPDSLPVLCNIRQGDSCRLPGHALAALFQAVANHPTLISLGVFDHMPLQGVGNCKSTRQPPPDESVGVAHQSGLF